MTVVIHKVPPTGGGPADKSKPPTLARRGLWLLVLLTHQELDVGHDVAGGGGA